MSPIELVLSKLADAKATGQGKWMAHCPAHDDRRPSLSIAEGDDGRALVYCHAGCTAGEVTRAMGLKMQDLMPARDPVVQPQPALAGKASQSVRPRKEVYGSADDAVSELKRRHGNPAATWEYHNAEGVLVGLVIRWNLPPDPGNPAEEPRKEIRPIARIGEGWVVGGMPEPRPLYRLPELLNRRDERVFVCEGEKAADALRSVGLLATTSPHGSQSASKADWVPLAARDVVILPDNDAAGDRYADDVIELLSKLTPAAKVRRVSLPDLPAKGDAFEYIESRRATGTPDTEIRAGIERLVDETAPSTVAMSNLRLTWRPFPVDALPEPLREFVRRSAEAIGCDASFLALPALSVLASCIGNHYRVLLKRNWTEPAILWTLTLGESGVLKSPPLRAVLRRIREVERDMFDEHRRALKQFEIEKMRHEVDMTRWKKGGCTVNAPVEPEPPALTRLIVQDVTIEALVPILLANPRGVILARDELAAWIGAFNQYKGGKGSDAAAWLSTYDGDTITVDRKGGNPPTLRVPLASVSVTGTMQPGTLIRVMSAELREAGLLARVLMSKPPGAPAMWSEAEVPEVVEKQFDGLIDALLQLSPGFDEHGHLCPRLIGLDAFAKAIFVKWHNRHVLELGELIGDMAAAFSKLKGACARLALIIHCSRVAACDPALTSPGQIDLNSMQAAIELTEWFKHEARRIYAMISEGDDDRDRRMKLELIQRKGGSVSVRDWQRARSFHKSDDAEADLNELVKGGLGCWETSTPGAKGGRSKTVFRLSDVTDTDRTTKFTAKSEVVSVSESSGAILESSPSEDEDRRQSPL